MFEKQDSVPKPTVVSSTKTKSQNKKKKQLGILFKRTPAVLLKNHNPHKKDDALKIWRGKI